jgi:hypothetical protein
VFDTGEPFGCQKPLTAKRQKALLQKYGTDNWYDWAIRNWGTKWGVYEVSDWDEIRGGERIFFQSAWSPISKIMPLLSKKFPRVHMVLKYADEGGGFLGFEVYLGGQKSFEQELGWLSSDGGADLLRELYAGSDWVDEALQERAEESREEPQKQLPPLRLVDPTPVDSQELMGGRPRSFVMEAMDAPVEEEARPERKIDV